MHGRGLFAGACVLVTVFLISPGCDELPSLPLKTPEKVELPLKNLFDGKASGAISGMVTWAGALPRVKPFQAPLGTGAESLDRTLHLWPNPHAPKTDVVTRGVGDAVVFLRGVSAREARPWDLPPVRIEMRGGQFHVHQGDVDSRVGFVRQGDAVEMTSRDPWFEILQAREADFFSVPFPDPDVTRSRRLLHPGRVEFISGAGHYWMRAHLFVAEHPYYTRTDSAGRFTLPQIPPGAYQLVCWHPNWRPGDYERDLGTMLVTHVAFRPAVEVIQPIRVERSATVNATITMSSDDFDP